MILFRYPVFYCVVGLVLTGLVQPFRNEWWGLIVLATLMFLYAFVSQADKAIDRREVGDNCYFIGFVYTLSLITWSLILDAKSLLNNESGNLEPLLITIGIALGTSVWGMILRFYFSHGVQTPENDFQVQVRKAAVAANQMAGAANKISAEAEKIAPAMANYSECIKVEATKIGSQLADTSKTVLEKLHDITVVSITNAEKAKQAIGALEDALGSAKWKEVDETIILLSQRLDGLNNSMQRLSQKQAEIAQTAEKDVGRLVETGELFGDLKKDLNKDIEEIAKIKEEYRRAYEKAAQTSLTETHKLYADLMQKQTEIIQTAERDLERLAETSGLFGDLKKDLNKDIEEIAKIKDDYRRVYEEAAQTALAETHKLYASLIAGAEIVLSELDKAGVKKPQALAKQIELGKGKR